MYLNKRECKYSNSEFISEISELFKSADFVYSSITGLYFRNNFEYVRWGTYVSTTSIIYDIYNFSAFSERTATFLKQLKI